MNSSRSQLVVQFVALSAGWSLSAAEPSDFGVQQEAARTALQTPVCPGPAKNIILFLGDGMGMTTITGARILAGQKQGKLGEEHTLSFETFEHTALSKTYTINQQTPDSAGTMTAIMTGHKTNAYIINYDQNVELGNHKTIEDFGGPSQRLPILTEELEKQGKSTGIVTTTTLVHATPAACYAHSPNRFWVDDNFELFEKNEKDKRLKPAINSGFKDIARQLIEFPYGDGIDVALGGGWRSFLPQPESKSSEDTEKKSKTPQVSKKVDRHTFTGRRLDGRDLTREWASKTGKTFVKTKDELRSVDTSSTKQLLGLFNREHMSYAVDRLEAGAATSEPSLTEMALKALEILKQNPKGYFLMVESGRIDHGHHGSNAHRALNETTLLSDAVQAVLDALSPAERAETLIIVTADHSHTFTLAGYPTRGNPILGKVIRNDNAGHAKPEPEKDLLGLPFTTLGYANGGGYTGPMMNKKDLTFSHGHQQFSVADDGPKTKNDDWKYVNIAHTHRPDLHNVDTSHPNYVQESAVPLGSETHGAEDVPIYATGPGAFLFRGTREQNYIYHAMKLALELPSAR
jgi:alkaline phosphatase